MNNFNNDRGFKNFSDRGFGGGNRSRSFGGNRGGFGGGRSREDRQMFSAICDKCGAECELPFRPTGDKPVYCSNCFEKTGGRDGGERNFGGGRDFGGNNRRFESRDTKDYTQDNTRAEIEVINQKLDKILSILNSSKEFKKVTLPTFEKKIEKKVEKKIKKAKKIEAPVEETQE